MANTEFIGIPTKNVIIIVVTVTGCGVNPNNKGHVNYHILYIYIYFLIVGGSFGIRFFSCLLTHQVEMIGLDTTVMWAVAGINMEVWLGVGGWTCGDAKQKTERETVMIETAAL